VLVGSWRKPPAVFQDRPDVSERKLLEALIDRDPPRARRAMREHVLEFQREMLLAYSQIGVLDGRR
jgi:DNA-binding GntR family transcriptional regulator